MFAATENFPGLVELQRGWREIRAELEALDSRNFIDWPETCIYSGNWTVFPFYRFGERLNRTCAVCPSTAARGAWTACPPRARS